MKYYGNFNQRSIYLLSYALQFIAMSKLAINFYYNFVLQNKQYLIEIVNSFWSIDWHTVNMIGILLSSWTQGYVMTGILSFRDWASVDTLPP